MPLQAISRRQQELESSLMAAQNELATAVSQEVAEQEAQLRARYEAEHGDGWELMPDVSENFERQRQQIREQAIFRNRTQANQDLIEAGQPSLDQQVAEMQRIGQIMEQADQGMPLTPSQQEYATRIQQEDLEQRAMSGAALAEGELDQLSPEAWERYSRERAAGRLDPYGVRRAALTRRERAAQERRYDAERSQRVIQEARAAQASDDPEVRAEFERKIAQVPDSTLRMQTAQLASDAGYSFENPVRIDDGDFLPMAREVEDPMVAVQRTLDEADREIEAARMEGMTPEEREQAQRTPSRDPSPRGDAERARADLRESELEGMTGAEISRQLGIGAAGAAEAANLARRFRGRTPVRIPTTPGLREIVDRSARRTPQTPRLTPARVMSAGRRLASVPGLVDLGYEAATGRSILEDVVSPEGVIGGVGQELEDRHGADPGIWGFMNRPVGMSREQMRLQQLAGESAWPEGWPEDQSEWTPEQLEAWNEARRREMEQREQAGQGVLSRLFGGTREGQEMLRQEDRLMRDPEAIRRYTAQFGL